MSLLNPPNSLRPSARRALPKPVTAADFERLYLLADELNGLPVPGVRMSESRFENWCDEDVRAEWASGEVILMTAASLEHGRINNWLIRVLQEYAEQTGVGEVLGPELMVRLAPLRRRRVPDVLFLAKSRASLLRDNYLEGSPDLIMEIVSPDSSVRDWQTKYIEYQQAGVREYWVIDPLLKRVEAYTLRAGKYKLLTADPAGDIRSKLLRGFFLRPAWLFNGPLPKATAVLKALGLR